MMEGAIKSLSEDGSNLNLDHSWTHQNPNGQNILYIAVGYAKEENDFKIEPDSITQDSTYNDFEQHVSPLDPNMSSVARYSPVYTESHAYNNSVVVTQLVSNSSENESNFGGLSNSESSLPTNLSTSEVQEVVGDRFLQMVHDDGIMTSDNSSSLPLVTDGEQEVELLITDQSTGISYSVNTQQYLVDRCLTDNQEFLEALAPDQLLDSDLLALDENSLKTQLSEMVIEQTQNTISAQEHSMFNKDLSVVEERLAIVDEEQYRNENLRRSQRQQSFTEEENTEEQLLSCVHTITDKPVPTRARATLPENYLVINKLYEGYGVFAKKLIPKCSQFGPLEGVLVEGQKMTENDKLLLLFEEENGKIQQMDISDENAANWMSYVRRASNYSEQNLVLMQQGNSLYYVSTKTILPKQELMVGYSNTYAQKHNLEVLQPPVEEKNSWHCFECSKSFASSNLLQKHLNIHDVKKDENTKPKKRLSKKKIFFKKRQKPEAVSCNDCNEIFCHPKYSILKRHLLTHDKDSVALIQDKFTIVKRIQCTDCNMSFSNEEQVGVHKNEKHKVEEKKNFCSKCNLKFETLEELHRHHDEKHPQEVKRTFCCPVCSKLFTTCDRMQKHVLIHGSDETKPYLCDKCAKRFLSSTALACHRKTHFRKHFECSICKETFTHVLQLKQHTDKHSIDGKFPCPLCNRIFGKYYIIRKHIRGFHSEKTFTCTDCIKSFSTLDKLQVHLLKHSDHKEFLCADCGKQFKRKDKLKEHTRRMHSEERENSSPIEQRTPHTKTDYHRFIYKCHSCFVGFKRRGMLVNHLAKRHPDISPDTVPELNLPILRTTRDYYCQYCDKVYKSSSKRKAHILKNHPGAELPMSNRKVGANENPELPNSTYSHAVGSITTHPQPCQWCHKQYASKAKLLQHQRKKHADLLELRSKLDVKAEILSNQNVAQNPVEEIAIDTQCFKRDFKVSDELINEMVELEGVRENTQYYHLVSMSTTDNSFIPSNDLSGSDSRLYRLLTTGNIKKELVPPVAEEGVFIDETLCHGVKPM